MKKPATQPILTGGSIGLVLFVASAIAGMWVAYDSSLGWPILLALLGSVGLFFIIANSTIVSRWTAGGLVIIASLFAIYFVSQYAHFDYQDETGPLAELGWATGSLLPDLVFFTPHPNAAAGFLEGTLLLNLVLIWQARGFRRLVWGLTAIIIAYGLLISGSRGAWSGLVVAIGIWISLRFPKYASMVVGLGLGLTASFLLSLYVISLLGLPDPNVPLFSSMLNTSNSRLILYRNSLALLGDYPFTGIGLGDTFAMLYSRYQLFINVPYLYYAHNLFLSVALGQGILGIVALVWLLIGFYRFVIRVERVGLNGQSLPIFRAAWLGTTTSLIHGLTDSVQFSGDYWTMPMLFALAGLTIAIGHLALAQIDPRQVSRASTQKYHRKQWIGLAAIAIAVAISITIFWQVIASAWYANVGAIYQAQADLSPNVDDATREVIMTRASVYFEHALDLNPSQAVANRRLGMMALERQDFETAIIYLERAYTQEPQNQAILKTLGYAYLWTGQLDQAQELFWQVDFQSRLVGELRYWHWWWSTKDQENLSAYAGEMAQRLVTE